MVTEIQNKIQWRATFILLGGVFGFFLLAMPMFAQAAPPAFVACGAYQGPNNQNAITPALPSGLQVNDILLLFLETANDPITIPTPNGGTWIEVTNSPQGTGTAGGTSATRLTVFWSRYNGTQGNPTTSDSGSGNHQNGVICAWRGVITSGNPWDVTSGGVETTSDSTWSIIGATTGVSDALVLIAAARMDDSNAAHFSAWTNADIPNILERADGGGTGGNGGGIGVAEGQKTTPGSYTSTTVTNSTATVKGFMTIALKPEPPPANQVTVGTALTQPSYVVEGNTNVVMGAFTFISSASSANISSIKISETDPIMNASANLSNVRIYYETAASCGGYDGTEFLFGSASFVSEIATISGSMPVGTSQVCAYVVLDVGASAGALNNIEIEITASGDVTASGGMITGTFPVQISGNTIIRADSGTIMSSEIDFDWVPGQTSWGEVILSTTETDGDVKIRVYRTASAPCDTMLSNLELLGNETGLDASSPLSIASLSDVTTTYNKICIQATLTAGAFAAPTLNQWAVTWAPPLGAFEQSAYRFFENDDATTVTTALAAQDTSAILISPNQAFRLRLLIHVGGSALPISGQNFKLQYSPRSGSCDAGFVGETYGDVTTSGAISYNNNSPPDSASLTPNVSLDPTHSGHTVVSQTYEELNNFTNAVAAIPSGQDGQWDFVLKANSAPSNTSYCFRAVKSDGSLLPTYTVIPEIVSPVLYALSGTYISSPFDTGTPSAFTVIEWDWSKTNGSCSSCAIRFQIQTSPDGASWTLTWSGPDGDDGDEIDYFTMPMGEIINKDHNGDRWVRYRATFDGDGVNTPILEEMRIFYHSQQ